MNTLGSSISFMVENTKSLDGSKALKSTISEDLFSMNDRLEQPHLQERNRMLIAKQISKKEEEMQ